MSKTAIVCLVIAFLLAVGIWQWHRYASGRTLTSDADLIKIFHEHRSTLERLHRMAVEDNLDGLIGHQFVDDKNLTQQRINEYRNLMRRGHVEVFVAYWTPPWARVSFWVDWQSSAIGGRLKGIAYYPEQPLTTVLPSLEESCLPAVGPDAESCSVVRQIEGNWWLVREEDR